MTMTKEQFFAAWRAECRRFLEIVKEVGPRLNHIRRSEEAVRRHRAEGPLLLDRVRAGELVVIGWKEGNDASVGRA